MQTTTRLCTSSFATSLSTTCLRLAGRWWLLPASLALASCTAQRIELQQQSLDLMPGKKLAVVTYERPTFVDFKPGNAVFGIVGALVAQEQGNSLVKQYMVQDPAAQVAQLLAQRLVQERGMVLLAPPQTALASDDIGAVLAAQPGADYILDIKTTGWATMYYPTDWTHYKVSYSARLRLIDAHSKLVLAQQACYSVQKDNEPKPPSKDDLLAHDASLLKQRLVLGASDCMNGFASASLKLAAEVTDDELVAVEHGAMPTVSDQHWHASMHCGPALEGNARRPEPYSARYDVDVSRYPVIRLRRRSANVSEDIAGKVVNGRLAMRGSGYRLENPATRWALRFTGTFNGDGSDWEGSGGLSMRNSQVRVCKLSLKKA